MRKLYGEFTKVAWLRVSGMKVDEVPDAIIQLWSFTNLQKWARSDSNRQNLFLKKVLIL